MGVDRIKCLIENELNGPGPFLLGIKELQEMVEENAALKNNISDLKDHLFILETMLNDIKSFALSGPDVAGEKTWRDLLIAMIGKK